MIAETISHNAPLAIKAAKITIASAADEPHTALAILTCRRPANREPCNISLKA